jgi:hypothetical protein
MIAVITALTALLVMSCGGGGGDSPAPRVLQPISYTGNTFPTAITLANTPILVTNVLFGGSAASDIPVAVIITETDTLSGDNPAGADELMNLVHSSMDNILGDATHGYQMPTAEVINETEYCVSGYYTVKGTLDDMTGTGTLTFDYYNCLMDGMTFDGMLYVHVHYIDYYSLNMTMDFVLMTVTGPGLNVSMSGTILLDDSISGNSLIEQITQNYVEKVNITGMMYKYENFVVTATIDDIYSYYSSGSISYTGAPVAIIYDSNYGGLTVDTITPLLFSSTTRLYPDLGGQLVFTGDLSAIQLVVESARHLKLELDLDGAVGYEVVRYVLWSELDDVANLNLADSDGDAMHDSWESTYGLNPYVDDAADNFDNDGLTNLEEYEQGYDPSNPLSPTT